jgi:hypothetical protein
MSRTYRQIGPHRQYLGDKWYKHQEEKRAGNGVYVQALRKNTNSSNRVKARMAAQKHEESVQRHHEDLG